MGSSQRKNTLPNSLSLRDKKEFVNSEYPSPENSDKKYFEILADISTCLSVLDSPKGSSNTVNTGKNTEKKSAIRD